MKIQITTYQWRKLWQGFHAGFDYDIIYCDLGIISFSYIHAKEKPIYIVFTCWTKELKIRL